MTKKNTTYKTGIQQEFINEDTGELVRQYVVTEVVPNYIDVKLPKKEKFNNGNFITIFQNTMYNISKYAKLTKNEYQLLIFLLGTAGLDNSICVDLNILSEELNLKKPNLSTALKGLEKRNIIIRKNQFYKGGKKEMELSLNYDQLNYELAFKGKIKEYKTLKFNHPEIVSQKAETNLLEVPKS